MVMGPTHAMSGACFWLVGAAPVAALLGQPLTGAQVAVGTGVCAGAAMASDIDEPSSTVSRSMGPLTEGLAHVVSGLSVAYYNATRTERDGPSHDGHRKLTHTAAFAIAMGFGTAALCGWGGQWAAIGVLFFSLSLAIRGLMHNWAKRNGWLGVTAASAIVSWYVGTQLPNESYWWLCFAVTAGILFHQVMDCPTKDGCPMGAPFLVINGKRWWDVAPPGFMRFRASGPMDGFLMSVFTAATVPAAIYAYDPALFWSLVEPITGSLGHLVDRVTPN